MEVGMDTNVLAFGSFSAWRLHLVRAAAEGVPVHFIPTMGALHDGHAALIRSAREAAEGRGGVRPMVVASVYVNPTQFNDRKDLDTYPRMPEEDLACAIAAGADAVVFPDASEMYPEGLPECTDAVDYGSLTARLEGAKRPGHFDGVVTVVRRLFDLVQPDKAFFGEKDWQQLAVIRRLAELEFPELQVVPVPTVRESDGLAMSSRNARIPGALRPGAARLHEQMRRVVESMEPESACIEAKAELESNGFEVEYLEWAHGMTLEGVPWTPGMMRLFAAVRYAGVRLIDNLHCSS